MPFWGFDQAEAFSQVGQALSLVWRLCCLVVFFPLVNGCSKAPYRAVAAFLAPLAPSGCLGVLLGLVGRFRRFVRLVQGVSSRSHPVSPGHGYKFGARFAAVQQEVGLKSP